MPAVSQEEIGSLLKKTKVSDFKIQGSAVASSGDMAYAYGTATFEEMKDGKPEKRSASYLHIWKVEKNQWKLVLEVIS